MYSSRHRNAQSEFVVSRLTTRAVESEDPLSYCSGVTEAIHSLGEMLEGEGASRVVVEATDGRLPGDDVHDDAWAKPAAVIWASARLLARGHIGEETKARLLGQMRESAESLALALAHNARRHVS